jgi:metal-dependent amidase/aminoacylase/carboxypeptidase family protein
LGVNSEMDALPGIGHACGHNLIGISGVAVALAAKAAMKSLNIDGKVVLLGTPGALVSANICDGRLRDNTRGSRRGWFWQGHAV